ncbi:MAG: type II toxin-antitoxin system VapC family toxin [Sphingorhabdus sp.]
MIVVDSSVWIDYFRGVKSPQTDRLDILLEGGEAIIGDLMLTEVLQGCNSDREFIRLRQLLGILDMIEIGGWEVAVEAAANFRHLRALGITPRKTIDTLIATRCIMDGLPLLFSDRDFDAFVVHLGLVDGMS